MTRINMFLMMLTLVVITGCASNTSAQVSGLYVALDTVKDSQIFEETLSENQVKASILEGATNAGWNIEDSGDNPIVASIKIRTHMIEVYIFYSNFKYDIVYKSSIRMKMYCSKQDMDKRRNQKISGQENCPFNQPPQYIHRNYDTWINALVSEIEKSRTARL